MVNYFEWSMEYKILPTAFRMLSTDSKQKKEANQKSTKKNLI